MEAATTETGRKEQKEGRISESMNLHGWMDGYTDEWIDG